MIAEIFEVVRAVFAGLVRGIEPGHSDPVPFFQSADTSTAAFDHPYGLMSGNDGKFRKRQVTFDSMKISVAHSTATHAKSNFAGTWSWYRNFLKAKRRLLHGQRFAENHRSHEEILFSRNAGC
jgi:hypothetical protein